MENEQKIKDLQKEVRELSQILGLHLLELHETGVEIFGAVSIVFHNYVDIEIDDETREIIQSLYYTHFVESGWSPVHTKKFTNDPGSPAHLFNAAGRFEEALIALAVIKLGLPDWITEL